MTLRLIDFLGVDNAPSCFGSVSGVVDKRNFTVTENAPFTFPVRNKRGSILHLGIIDMDAWVGKVFERPIMRTRPIAGRKAFHFGNDN
jgi:hypothetical protein